MLQFCKLLAAMRGGFRQSLTGGYSPKARDRSTTSYGALSKSSKHSAADNPRGAALPAIVEDDPTEAVSAQPSRLRAADAAARNNNWDAVFPRLHVLRIQDVSRRHEHNRARLRSEQDLLLQLAHQPVPCPSCSGTCSASAPLAFSTHNSTSKLIVMPEFHFWVQLPLMHCSACGTGGVMQPHSLMCWPATPAQPTVWYSERLLDDALHVKLTMPGGVRAFCQAKHALHTQYMPPHQCEGFDTVWRNFGPAWERYRGSSMQMVSPSALGLQPIAPGCTPHHCPSCWRTCTAVMMDGCLGLTRLRKAAKSQRERPSTYQGSNSIWVPDQEVKEALQANKGIKLPGDACADFKVVKALGRRSEVYEELGECVSGSCCMLSLDNLSNSLLPFLNASSAQV